ncbi:hypothetical protein CBS101457_000193 [Exobasidium rhododendri]|nr:hypothetical protein CBS101457_000193 [Exobasidium rhododendri]
MDSGEDSPRLPKLTIRRPRSSRTGPSGSLSSRAVRASPQVYDVAPPSTSRPNRRVNSQSTNEAGNLSSMYQHTSLQPGLADRQQYDQDNHFSHGQESGLYYPVPHYGYIGEFDVANLSQSMAVGNTFGDPNIPSLHDSPQQLTFPTYSNTAYEQHHDMQGYTQLPYSGSSSGDASTYQYGQLGVPSLQDTQALHGYNQDGTSYSYDSAMQGMNLGSSSSHSLTTEHVHDSVSEGATAINPRHMQEYIERMAAQMNKPFSSNVYHSIPPATEYTYQLETAFDFTPYSEDQNIYLLLPEDYRTVILDQIYKIRPINPKSVRSCLVNHLKPAQAQDLISYDTVRIDEATQELFPDGIVRKYDRTFTTTWMTDLSNADRREVIRRLSEVTLQAGDVLREHFLHANIEPRVIQYILQATTQERIWEITQFHNLFFDVNNKDRPWQKGLSFLQRKALRQRFKLAGITEESQYYGILKREKIPPGYGLTMLKVGDADLLAIIKALRTRNALLPVISLCEEVRL